MAGELAFASATTNNQSVMVDFASWVQDRNLDPMVLGNVTNPSPPPYAEAVYIALDLGNGNVKIILDDSAARTSFMPIVGSAPMINSVWDLDRAYKAYKAGTAPKPIPRRCAGALFLAKHYGEPAPTAQCDVGLEWAFGFCAQGGGTWSGVSGTTGPMNGYMRLTSRTMPYRRTIELSGNSCGGTLLPVLSETYVHMWERNYDLSAACTAESDATFCARQGKTCGSVTAIDNCGNSRTATCGAACPAVTTTSYQAEDLASTISGSSYALVCNKSASADPSYAAAGCTRGALIRSLGNGSNNYVTLNNVSAPAAGSYKLTVWSVVGPDASGYAQTRTAYLSINGGTAITMNVSGPDWETPVATTANVTLNAGVNTIKFYNPTAGQWAPDLDRIDVDVCTPESDAAFCSRLAKNCGAVTGIDSCGSSRTVSSCGSCTSPQTCGTSNVCGTVTVTNLFANPSFASGTTSWLNYFSTAGSWAGNATAQDGDAKSLKVTIGSYSGTTWDNHQVFQTRTVNGSPYTVKAYFQKTEGTSKSATVYCSENGGSYTLYGSSTCTNTSGWTACQVTCTPPSGKSVKFGIGIGSSNVDTLIDNMTLTQ
jgi:hypothetical protein